MKIAEMNWRQVEAYLKHDDRAVIDKNLAGLTHSASLRGG